MASSLTAHDTSGSRSDRRVERGDRLWALQLEQTGSAYWKSEGSGVFFDELAASIDNSCK